MPETANAGGEHRAAMQRLLLEADRLGASDLHLVAGECPTCRIHGQLQPVDQQALSDVHIRHMLTSICPAERLDEFLVDRDLDFSYEMEHDGELRRFRANYFFSQRRMGGCFRLIPSVVPDLEWAGFPRALAERIAHFRNGLVLITGVAGSGKTTTLAMIIRLLTNHGGYRIITIEEPIEYLFPASHGSIISQREVGLDVRSFSDGLKYGLRQDPDIILVGEIRDRDTAQMALSAAETGHLVLATMHTRDAKGAISRYTDLFPQGVQHEIRGQMALGLRAVVSQHLLPSAEPDNKRELAVEVLANNLPVSSAIRMGKIESIDNCILTGKSDGMVTLDESLKRLLQAGKITRETAVRFVSDPHMLASRAR